MSRKANKNKALPAGWREVRLGDIYNVSAGGDLDTRNFSPTPDKYHPYPIYSNALTNKGLYGYSSYAEYEDDSITITARGDIGNANHRSTKFVAIGRLLILRNKISVVNKFVCEYINHKIRFFKETTGVPQLTVPQVSKYRILLPTPHEQKAIASVLQTWDTAIEKTEALIAAKEKQFKWLLKRLIGDQQDDPKWRKAKLGRIAQIETGSKNNQDKSESGKYPFFVRSNKVEKINSYSFDGEAILIPGEGEIGKVVHYIEGKFDYHQRVYKISNFSNDIFGRYAFWFLKVNFPARARQFSVKATADSLRKEAFSKMPIHLPSKTTQKYIANILDSAQKEISLLSDFVKLYRAQKRGLMQKLLVGEWRMTT